MITYPLNKIEYNATDAELFHCTRNSGIYAGDDFVCTVTGADNNVTIGTGIGWIRNSKFSGKVIANKSDVVLDLGLADASFNRWDIVAIQFDKNNNATDFVVKHGATASTPVRPEIVQTETLYELYLAAFYRKAGATTITANDVYDLRLDPTVCGLMADSVTEIDTTGINAQINALIEELREEIAGVESSAEIMLKSVYDTDNDGTVDDAEKLNGQSASYYATKTEVETAQTTADDAVKKTVTVTTTGTDLNDYKETGIYYFASSVIPTNIPVGSNGWLVVYAVKNRGECKQVWYRMGTPSSNDHDIYVRSCNNAGLWGDWVKVITEKDSGMDLLWTNASPTSSFGEQKINVDLSKYTRVLIPFRLYSEASTTIPFEFPVDSIKYSATVLYNSRGIRALTVTPTGVEFAVGLYSNTVDGTVSENDKAAIPQKIIGIK